MSSSPEYTGKPCIEMITSNAGDTFSLGVTGGGLYYFIKGSYNSHNSFRERFIAGTKAARLVTPRFASRLTLGCMLFDSLQHSVAFVKQKKDPLNVIVAAVGSGGVIGMRHGPRVALPLALIFGARAAFYEGSCTILERIVEHYKDPN